MFLRKIVFIFFISAFSAYGEGILKEVFKISIAVPEPSSLVLDEGYLWTVSDFDGKIYKMDMSGRIKEIFDIGPGDRESICIDDEGYFYLADERLSEVLKTDLKRGIVKKKYKLFSGKTGKNSGIEGIAFCPDRNSFFAVKEKAPTAVIEYDREFKELAAYPCDFAKDLSDIFYDCVNRCFWIVSHKTKAVFIWTPESGAKDRYFFDILQAEGIAVDFSKNQLLIVSDKDNMIHGFELPVKYIPEKERQ